MTDLAGFFLAHPTTIQVALFASTFALLTVLEYRDGRSVAGPKWRHAASNGLFVLSALPIQIALMTCTLALAHWTTVHHWGLVYLLPHADDPWIRYGLMFVVLDLLDYVYHVSVHQFAPFWRFHLVHHTDTAVDVSTTVREHPGETCVRNAFLMMWVGLCGASVEVLVLRQTTETLSNLWSHTAVRLPERWARVLGWLFITPNLHHAHHHRALPATNRNYGDIFSVWDRLFGTYTAMAAADVSFGLEPPQQGAGERWLRATLARLGVRSGERAVV